MKTIIQGKNLKTFYRVEQNLKTIKDDEGRSVEVYTAKPRLVKEVLFDNWETIKEFDEDIKYNSINYNCGIWGMTRLGEINLTEEEVVKVENKIMRVDLGAYVLHTDKILSEVEFDKETSEEILACRIKAFNKMMIESNDKLLSYCKLHKLNPEETNVDELFELVYPGRSYKIVDGKLIVDESIYSGIKINPKILSVEGVLCIDGGRISGISHGNTVAVKCISE